MPKGRLVFDGDNIYTEKNARVYKLKQEISSRIDAIPGVIDDLNSTSTTDALSANMGRELQDQISALSGNFHFLSTWDCTTGLPGTNPAEDPYNYESGDYYIVSMVAGSGGTNYKPQGGSYVQGVPSTAVETGTVNLSDWYVYDGATWILQPAGSWHIIVDDQLDATSTNPVQNRIITQALANKQNTITNLSTIESGAAAGATALQPGDNISSLTNNSGYQTAGDVAAALGDVIHTGTTAPSNPTEGQLWYDTTNDVLKVYDGTQWNIVGVNGSDVNTKTFPLSGTTGATALAEAQAIYDWYDAGKNPLILYNEQIYLFYSELTNSISFIAPHSQRSDLGTTSFIMQRTLTLTLSSDTVSGITASDTMVQGLLMTGYDYPTPYVPEYDGSPSNKKYVDDKVRSAISVIATAPSTPTEGMLWYDTTNDVLKVYDGTQWNIVGGSGTTYTAGDNIDITNDTISVENAIVTDNTNDTGFRIEGSGGEYYDNTSISSVVLGYEPNEHQNGQLSFDVGTGILSTSYTENAQGTTYESTRLAIDNYAIDIEYEYDNGGGDADSFSEHYTWFGDGPIGSSTNKIAKIGDIQNVINSGTTSPSDPTEGQLWYDTTNHVLKVYNGTAWVALDTNTTYTAGTGISIDVNNEISNTGVLSSNNTYNNIVYLSQSDYDNLQNKDANTLYSTPDAGDVSFVDDTAYAASWDGDTTHAPSKNAMYDKVNSMKEFVASEGAVRVFDYPTVGDDFTDVLNWLDNGGTVVFKKDESIHYSDPEDDETYIYYYQVGYYYYQYTSGDIVFYKINDGGASDVFVGTVEIHNSIVTYIDTYTKGAVPLDGTTGQVLMRQGGSPYWRDASSVALKGGSMGTFIRAAQQAGTKHTIDMGTDNTYIFQGVGWVKVSNRWGWACEINDEQMFYESHGGGTYVLKYPAMFITMGQGDKVRLYRPGNAGGCTYEVADYY